jgi:hypothetical protein
MSFTGNLGVTHGGIFIAYSRGKRLIVACFTANFSLLLALCLVSAWITFTFTFTFHFAL